MTIRFQCADCGRMLQVDRRHAGTKMKCPNCGRIAKVPADAKTSGPEPPEEVEAVRFVGKHESDDEMDMTPMVDITFLLLIFFMVTAAFSLQRSIEIPPPDRQENTTQARTLEEIEQDDDYVIVEIHSDNSVFVDDSPAPSEQELLIRLRDARGGVAGSDSKGPSNLLVLAHGDSRHETVVMALDAGNAVGMENVRLATREEDF